MALPLLAGHRQTAVTSEAVGPYGTATGHESRIRHALSTSVNGDVCLSGTKDPAQNLIFVLLITEVKNIIFMFRNEEN